MVVSAPLSVVSCGRNKDRVVDDIDFQYLINLFISEVSTIFQTNIQKYFSEKSWIFDDNIPEGLKIQDFKNRKDELRDENSEFFKLTSDYLYSMVSINEINKQIVENVTNDINYNPILIDKDTPLKSEITVSFIELIENVYCGVSVNIFSEELLANYAIDLNNSYLDLLNKNLANTLVYKSDKGNLEKTTIVIKSGSGITSKLKEEISKLEIDNFPIFETKILTNELSLTRNEYIMVDPGALVIESQINTWLSVTNAETKIYLKAMYGEEEAEKTFYKWLGEIKFSYLK
ncbi:hypothetical protein SSABA_v1c08710 [Spiroplasma sabaudiense Ar-1343]|uniref:Uncharacterized protein n=1 Tax=Spiroplasma sabaudiense Ar-1343 TaxID=1276257 RepID=W6ABR2_9MOLU|nr:hypothetical protein [Spiroplasma sabaudiense]AHI54270.1 hypothetical protein SSABA_v1c08710 [Spiroplasma sabaudiense Ar-1343]